MESWRGWVPVSQVRDDQGTSGVIYLCSYSLYKAIKGEWLKRGESFKDMSFWVRKAYIGRFAPYEVSWTQPT